MTKSRVTVPKLDVSTIEERRARIQAKHKELYALQMQLLHAMNGEPGSQQDTRALTARAHQLEREVQEDAQVLRTSRTAQKEGLPGLRKLTSDLGEEMDEINSLRRSATTQRQHERLAERLGAVEAGTDAVCREITVHTAHDDPARFREWRMAKNKELFALQTALLTSEGASEEAAMLTARVERVNNEIESMVQKIRERKDSCDPGARPVGGAVPPQGAQSKSGGSLKVGDVVIVKVVEDGFVRGEKATVVEVDDDISTAYPYCVQSNTRTQAETGFFKECDLERCREDSKAPPAAVLAAPRACYAPPGQEEEVVVEDEMVDLEKGLGGCGGKCSPPVVEHLKSLVFEESSTGKKGAAGDRSHLNKFAMTFNPLVAGYLSV